MLNENDLAFLKYGVCCNYLISQNETDLLLTYSYK